MIEQVSIADFDERVLGSDVPVLVDFYQDHCLPCKKLAPVLEEASSSIEGVGRIFTVQFEKSPELVFKYDVTSFPTMILFVNGTVSKRLIGPRPLDAVMELFAV